MRGQTDGQTGRHTGTEGMGWAGWLAAGSLVFSRVSGGLSVSAFNRMIAELIPRNALLLRWVLSPVIPTRTRTEHCCEG